MIDAPSLMCILWWISFESCWIQLALNFLLAWCLISHYYVPESDIQVVMRWESVTGVITVIRAWECDPRVITPRPSLILSSHAVNIFSRIKESWFYILKSQDWIVQKSLWGWGEDHTRALVIIPDEMSGVQMSAPVHSSVTTSPHWSDAIMRNRKLTQRCLRNLVRKNSYNLC